MNKVILSGNLGADPELKYTPSNQPVLSMRLATSEKWKDKNGETQERTDWHSLTLWGKRAEALSKFLRKGEKVLVEGRIQYRQWEKDGQKRYATDINVTEIELLGKGKSGSKSNDSGDHGGDTGGSGGGDFGDDDIPFAALDERLF